MAIFSRRTIQRLFNENNRKFHFSVKTQHLSLNAKPSGYNKKFLSTEWEVVILNVFAKVFTPLGKVTTEKQFNGEGSEPDIIFESEKYPDTNFVADITTRLTDGRSCPK